MDLHISVFLLFVLVTAGHSFRCYHCSGTTSDTCEQTTCNEYSSCFAVTAYFDDNTTVVKSNFLSNGCPSGSINFSMMKTSIYCCDTDLFNAQNVSDPNNNTANGMTCYYCDGQSCSNTANCSGTEDLCFNASGNYAFEGCVSESICAATTFIPFILNLTCCEGNLCNGNNITQSITQSSTQSSNSTQSTTQSSNSTQSTTQSSNSTQSTTQSWSSTTANSANSVSQSFLFLCCSLLSFILLH